MATRKPIDLVYDGYHGLMSLRFYAPAGADLTGRIPVSARVARRLNAAVCPAAECACGERVAQSDDWGQTWYVDMGRARDGMMRGNYPSSR